jgi:hypothetical protein
MAHFSQDPLLLHILKNENDIFTSLAAKIHSKSEEQITRQEVCHPVHLLNDPRLHVLSLFPSSGGLFLLFLLQGISPFLVGVCSNHVL